MVDQVMAESGRRRFSSDEEVEDGSSDGSDASDGEDSNLASPVGSTLTVKYKARSSSSSSGHNSPLTGSDRSTLPQPTPPQQYNRRRRSEGVVISAESRLIIGADSCGNFIKPLSLNDTEMQRSKKTPKSSSCGRSLCLFCVVFLSIILLTSLCIGVLFWSDPQRVWTLWSASSASTLSASSSSSSAPSAALSPGLNFTPAHYATDSPCVSRSSLGFLTDMFISGYDITRANPFAGWQGKALSRAVLAETSINECHLAADETCHWPQVRSRIIDSVQSYRRWIRQHVQTETDELTLSTSDADYLDAYGELVRGHVIIMTQLQCPLVQVSQPYAPTLSPYFVQQWAAVPDADRESALELMEDYGTHYVESATLGSQVTIRFVLNRTAVEALSAAKNLSLEQQATSAGLYVLSRLNQSMNLSPESQETALDFMAAAAARVYPPMESLNADWLQSVLNNTRSVLSLRLQPLDALFDDWPNGAKLADRWRNTRKWACSRLESRGLVTRCGAHEPKINDPASFTLPLLSVSTDSSTVHIRATWNHCTELCRADPLCSAATMCTGSCIEESNCALHRHQEFVNNSISSDAVTSIPLRSDLRPVALRGLTVHGSRPLYATAQLTDLASCARLCSRTWRCQVVSFTHLAVDNKLCRLYENMTGNELRQDGAGSATIFLMASFGPCFPDEVKHGKKEICPTNAECWNGVCVCRHGFYKNDTECLATSHNQIADTSVKKVTRKHKVKSTTLSSSTTVTTTTTQAAETTEWTTSSTSTTTEASRSRATVNGYYIRGVFVPVKPTTLKDTGWNSGATTESARTSSAYKPWQMRWMSGSSSNSSQSSPRG